LTFSFVGCGHPERISQDDLMACLLLLRLCLLTTAALAFFATCFGFLASAVFALFAATSVLLALYAAASVIFALPAACFVSFACFALALLATGLGFLAFAALAFFAACFGLLACFPLAVMTSRGFFAFAALALSRNFRHLARRRFGRSAFRRNCYPDAERRDRHQRVELLHFLPPMLFFCFLIAPAITCQLDQTNYLDRKPPIRIVVGFIPLR
jgi:hypothetical protein